MISAVRRVIAPIHITLSLLCREQKDRIRRVKPWEIIADNLSKAGWSWGCISAIDSNGRTIWIADAHRDDGKRLVVRGEENLSIAKALPKERQPRHGAIALRLPTGYSA